MSVEGVEKLLTRNGFEMEELSTPGELDVDIVLNSIGENKEIELPRFIRQIVHSSNEELKKNFQKFLKENRLSSHIRAIARRPS
jgi:hypothetical protein